MSEIKRKIKNKPLATFKAFLVSMGLYSRFVKNMSTVGCASDCSRDELVFYSLLEFQPWDYVIEAFPWMDTPEGLDYWDAVSDVWVAYAYHDVSMFEAYHRVRLLADLKKDSKA